MRFNVSSFISLCMMGISIGVLVTALKWPFRTALFPVTIGISVLLIASVELVLSLFEKKETGEKPAEGVPQDSKIVDPALARRRTYIIFAWIFGFFLMVVCFGFPIAVPSLVFAFLKFQGKERWGLTLILTGITFIFFQGLFVWLLNTHFSEGLFIKGLRALF